MRTWYKVAQTADDAAGGLGSRLHVEFTTLFVANRFPAGPALLAAGDDHPEPYAIFFSPDAVTIAADLIRRYGAQPCAAPRREDVTPLVGKAPDSDFSSN